MASRWLSAVTILAVGAIPLAGAALDPSDHTDIFIDDVDYMVTDSNKIYLPWETLKDSLNHPASVNSTSYNGLDWTKPYPGEPIDGHKAYLTVARDVPIPRDISKADDYTTTASSITFSVPDSMMSGNDTLVAMDPSWHVCRAIFLGVKPESREAVRQGKGCGFLSNECQADLATAMTKNWGSSLNYTMCVTKPNDAIPDSCLDSFGHSRAVTLYFQGQYVNELEEIARINAVNTPEKNNYRVGTGFHDKGDERAYQAAYNRTYLVVTTWGYSRKRAGEPGSLKTPTVSLACLSPGVDAGVKKPEPGSASQTETQTSGTRTSSLNVPSGTSGSSRRYAIMGLSQLLGR